MTRLRRDAEQQFAAHALPSAKHGIPVVEPARRGKHHDETAAQQSMTSGVPQARMLRSPSGGAQATRCRHLPTATLRSCPYDGSWAYRSTSTPTADNSWSQGVCGGHKQRRRHCMLQCTPPQQVGTAQVAQQASADSTMVALSRSALIRGSAALAALDTAAAHAEVRYAVLATVRNIGQSQLSHVNS